MITLLSISAIFGAVLIITTRNPVIAVFFMILVFLKVAGYLVFLKVAYIGLTYLIVYIGAVAILFLFVVIILDLRRVGDRTDTRDFPLGGLVLFILLSQLDLLSSIPLKSLWALFESFDFMVSKPSLSLLYGPYAMDPVENWVDLLQVQSIGYTLYTYGSIWLFIAGFIFILAIIGPIVLTINSAYNRK